MPPRRNVTDRSGDIRHKAGRCFDLKYEDIINLPHHQSVKYKRMSMHDRAGQFSPFAALTGFGEEIDGAGKMAAGKYEVKYGEGYMVDDNGGEE